MKSVLLAIGLLFCAASASATSYTVKAGGGGSFTTIQACANTAVAGDTCTIFAGNYPETVTPANPGSAGNVITYNINPGDAVTMIGWVMGSLSYISVIGNTTPSLWTFTGGVTFSAMQHVIFQNIQNINGTGSGACFNGSGWYGTHTASSNNQFLNNVMSSCGGLGVTLSAGIEIEGHRNLIDGNTFSHVQSAVQLYGSFNVVRNNTFGPVAYADLGGQHSQPIESSGNCASSLDLPLVQMLYENNTSTNWLGTDSHAGFLLRDASATPCGMTGNVIRLSSFIGSGSYMAVTDTNDLNNYWYNVSASNTQASHSPKDFEDLQFVNSSGGWRVINSILANMSRVFPAVDYCIFSDATSSTNPITHSITYVENHNLCWLTGNTAGNWNGPQSGSPGAYDASDILTKDPLFVNPNSNLQLQAGSPAIGAGGPLTVAVGAGVSSTSLTVKDAGFFFANTGMPAAYQADTIRIGASTTVQIASINYSTNVITLASTQTWASNAPIYLAKDSNGNTVLNTANPAIGAFPASGAGPVLTVTQPPVVTSSGTFTLACGSSCGTFTSCTASGTDVSGNPTTALGSINSSTCVYTAPANITVKQSLAGVQLLPPNHILNVPINNLPVNTNSAAWIAQADTNAVVLTSSTPFNIIDNTVGNQTVSITNNPTGNGSFQVLCPPSGSIENGWDNSTGSDAHYFTVNHVTGIFQELYGPSNLSGCNFATSFGGVAPYGLAYPLPVGSGLGWSGADVAGMNMMAMQLHLQEMQNAIATSGAITHAIRVTIPNAELGHAVFLWPATNPSFSASGAIPVGARMRLKASYNCTTWSAAGQIICTALKNYGAIPDDGGFGFWDFVIDEDYWNFHPEIQEFISHHLHPSDFEFVDESGLMMNVNSGESASFRETICYNASTGTACTDVILQGITLGVPSPVINIVPGTPAQQLQAWVRGSANTNVTWTKPAAPSIQFAGSDGGQFSFGMAQNFVTSPGIATTTGNAALVCVDQGTTGGIPTSITDAAGDTFTHIAGADISPLSAWVDLSIAGTATNPVRVNFPGVGNFMGFTIRYFAPNGATMSVDNTSVSTTTTASTTSPFTSGIFSTTGTNEAINLCAHMASSNTFTLGAIAGVGAEGLSVDNPNPGTAQMASEDVVVAQTESGVTGNIAFATGATAGVMNIVGLSGSGGTPITGTLTSGGLYTAPATISAGSGEPVSTTITATSAASASAVAQIQLNIYPAPSGTISLFSDSPALSTTVGWPYPITVGGTTWTDMTNAWTQTGGQLATGGCAGAPPWATQNTAYIYRTKMQPSLGDERFDLLVPNGTYAVTSKWGECYWSSGGSEHTDPELNGTFQATNFNVFNSAGGQFIPYDIPTAGLVVTNNKLSFVVRTINGFNNGISALQIASTTPAAPSGTTISPGVKLNSGVTVQ